MPQAQKIVPFECRGGHDAQAVATGNNAAWLCECGRKAPLVGRSGLLRGVTEGSRIDCPDCQRSYFVVPAHKDRGRVLKVIEVVDPLDCAS